MAAVVFSAPSRATTINAADENECRQQQAASCAKAASFRRGAASAALWPEDTPEDETGRGPLARLAIKCGASVYPLGRILGPVVFSTCFFSAADDEPGRTLLVWAQLVWHRTSPYYGMAICRAGPPRSALQSCSVVETNIFTTFLLRREFGLLSDWDTIQMGHGVACPMAPPARPHDTWRFL